MSEAITLNFINKTQDIPAASVVICQHNAAAGMRCNPVAWRVLRDVTPEAPCSFEVPSAFEVALQDAAGLMTTPAGGGAGQRYGAVAGPTGVVLKEGGRDVEHAEDVCVQNLFEEETLNVTAHKSSRLVAIRTNIDPGDVAAFRFIDHIYVGRAGRLQEGDLISEAVASRITTRINLFGVRKADIVMTSSDKGARAPHFRLENIQC